MAAKSPEAGSRRTCISTTDWRGRDAQYVHPHSGCAKFAAPGRPRPGILQRRRSARRSGALDQAHESVQLVTEGRGDRRPLCVRQEGQGHDDDTATARPRYRSHVSTSLTARGDLAQVVNGARIQLCDDSQDEVLTTLRRTPARLFVFGDRVYESANGGLVVVPGWRGPGVGLG
jgi:hypothetical protein